MSGSSLRCLKAGLWPWCCWRTWRRVFANILMSVNIPWTEAHYIVCISSPDKWHKPEYKSSVPNKYQTVFLPLEGSTIIPPNDTLDDVEIAACSSGHPTACNLPASCQLYKSAVFTSTNSQAPLMQMFSLGVVSYTIYTCKDLFSLPHFAKT